MKPEYIEGPEAAKNFERIATAVFRATKAEGRKEQNAEPSKPLKSRKKKSPKKG
jgi:hypothetical protein